MDCGWIANCKTDPTCVRTWIGNLTNWCRMKHRMDKATDANEIEGPNHEIEPQDTNWTWHAVRLDKARKHTKRGHETTTYLATNIPSKEGRVHFKSEEIPLN